MWFLNLTQKELLNRILVSMKLLIVRDVANIYEQHFQLAILYPLNKFFKVESNFSKKKLNPADN